MATRPTVGLISLASVGTTIILTRAILRRRNQLAYDETDEDQVREELLQTDITMYQIDLPPVATLTWLRGDFCKAARLLEQHLQKILEANPWLAGRVGYSLGTQCLVYNRNSKKLKAKDYINSNVTNSNISRSTLLNQLFSKVRSFFLKNGVDQPLTNVTLLPCKDSPDTRFALIVAVSHELLVAAVD